MKEEIKEILDKLYLEFEKAGLTAPEYSDLRDYITNLKEENESLKEELKYCIPQVQHNQIVSKLVKEKHNYKSRNEKTIELLNRHDIDTGDIYYKYNGRFVKSELKERIREILGGDEEC